MEKENKFAQLVEDYARYHGLSHEVLAHSLGKIPQWLSALLRNKPDRVPTGPKKLMSEMFSLLCSNKALKNTLRLVERPRSQLKEGGMEKAKEIPDYTQYGEIHEMKFLRLLLSMVGMERMYNRYTPIYPFDHVKHLQDNLGKDDEVWVYAPVIGESFNPQFARNTAENIKKGIKYTFFIPINERRRGETAARLIDSYYRKLDTSDAPLKYRLEIFGVGGLFTHSLTILNPLDKPAIGHISVGGIDESEIQFIPLPKRRVYSLREEFKSLQIDGRNIGILDENEEEIYSHGEVKLARFFPKIEHHEHSQLSNQ